MHKPESSWRMRCTKLSEMKWYLQKTEYFLENEMHKMLWYFEIQTAHLILTRKPGNNLQKKENLPNSRCCHPSRPQNGNQRK